MLLDFNVSMNLGEIMTGLSINFEKRFVEIFCRRRLLCVD